MTAQIFLIAPMTADSTTFPDLLAGTLDAAGVSALLVPKGDRSDADYETLLRAVLPVAQEKDCAVLADNDAALAKKIGADGVHMSTGIKAFREAIDLLKPDLIVGAGDVHSHHDAMTKGEAGADYVLFGPLTGSTDPKAKEDAAWWAETFEIPAVFCDPEVTPETADPAGCEFIGLSDSIWSATDPAKALAAIANRLSAA